MLSVKLYSDETARIHTTRAGKQIAMPYPMSVSLSHRGEPVGLTAEASKRDVRMIRSAELVELFERLLASA